MKDQKERWIRLCEQAAVEQDHEKLLKLVSEIARMLDEKEQRVKQYSHSGVQHTPAATLFPKRAERWRAE
jgi:hypothetical protein